jgi:tetratricopeptide (TPR) repeat protein
LSDHLVRLDQAEAELKEALKIRPDYLPALLNLGNLYEDLGRREPAANVYRRALEIAPGNALALSRLAGVVKPASPAGAELAQRIQQLVESGGPAADRADLGFSLGRLLDGRSKYQSAFAAYEAANRASRESAGPAFPGYDRAATESFFERLKAAFASPAPQNGGSEAPVFIVGMFRSGSTLVEQILASHSRVVAGGELDLVPALTGRIPGYPESVADADESTITAWRRFYLDGARQFAREGALVTDKRPDNFLHIGLIKTLFPRAKIIHTRRNRLDNLLSLYFLQLGPAMPYALDLRDSAHWYELYEALMMHWKTLYPEDIFDLDYDELVHRPRPVTKTLLDRLGLDWEDAVLQFHKRPGPVKTASVWQVREALHARSSGRWRNYEAQLKHALGGFTDG